MSKSENNTQAALLVLATTSSFGTEYPELMELLGNYGLEAVLNPWGRKLTEEELTSLLAKHKPVGLLAGTEPVTQAVLEQAKDYLRVVSRVGAGWDNVDQTAAARLGILVFRTRGVLTQAVAELTMGLMLAALRAIPLQDRLLRQGCWQKVMGGLLHGKFLGIIGFGAIGQKVGKMAQAFGCEIGFFDSRPMTVSWAKGLTLPELLREADIISIHASGNQRILGAEELDLIGKRGVLLINTARGGLIDEAALGAALQQGRIGCACLDVFCDEPYRGPLCSLDNVIITPHIGSYAREARRLMEQTAVSNLITGLRQVKVL